MGEASLQSAHYHCDGKVIAHSEITQVPIQEIRVAMESDPAFSTRWIGMLNREVKRLRMQCERLSLHKVQDRLLHLLETEGKQGRYSLGSGLKSLAGELGVTHEALYRCVSELEKKNCLRRDSGFSGRKCQLGQDSFTASLNGRNCGPSFSNTVSLALLGGAGSGSHATARFPLTLDECLLVAEATVAG